MPPVRFGIRWTPSAPGPLAKSSGMSEIDGAHGLAIRMIPFRPHGGSARVSKRGETNPGRTARCIKYWRVKIIIWGHSLPGD